MKNTYEKHEVVTKEILDSIKVGDLVKINDWKRPLRVRAVTENYFYMSQKAFGNVIYSVCEKIPWGGIRYNAMRGGMFHCGRDNILFGHTDFNYETDDENEIINYLNDFDDDNDVLELSYRSAVPIYELYIKRS